MRLGGIMDVEGLNQGYLCTCFCVLIKIPYSNMCVCSKFLPLPPPRLPSATALPTTPKLPRYTGHEGIPTLS